MKTKDVPTLFLHGGPGLSAIAERELYGRGLPIHWWDQPRSVALFSSPFAALIDSAQEEIERLAHGNARPVNLIAHSFGAHLALRLAMRVPERLGRILLLAPVYDMGDAFVRLANRLLVANESSQPLLAALQEFKAASDYTRFAKLAAQITSIANFIDLYWSPRADERRRWYVDLLTHQPVIDLNAFEVLAKDFWLEPPMSVRAIVPESVHLVLGRADPLMDVDAERRIWTALFPGAVSHEVNSGHFVHLETPPETWWATRQGRPGV
ncbi:alpha/beta fold hydrolase [Paraburkholderia dilworthii]|uniref:Alpha/beta hydrolase n=1 Tax=Paraburkholderia dilworthii TaxID=948106 RepID=A0ABW9DIN7_9BURK